MADNAEIKVSVILPVFNVADYLEECLDSVIHQTFDDMEILCVDDGSTDSSPEILCRYAQKDGRIRILTGPNGGYGRAMNRGLDAARGKYIGIVEPDDYIAPDMYERLFRYAEEKDAELVKADFYQFTSDRDGNVQMHYVRLSEDPEDYGRVLCPMEERRCFRFPMNTWSGIYRRDFIEQFHIRHHETPGAAYQDNGFWFQTFVRAKRIAILNRPLYRNRRDNPKSSVWRTDQVYATNIEYDFIRSLFEHEDAIWEKVKYVYTLKRFHNDLVTLDRIAQSEKAAYLFRMSEVYRTAEKSGEVDPSVYTREEWRTFQTIMRCPRFYPLERLWSGRLTREETYNEAERIRNSVCGGGAAHHGEGQGSEGIDHHSGV